MKWAVGACLLLVAVVAFSEPLDEAARDKYAWKLACQVSEFSCEHLDAPTVVRSRTIMDMIDADGLFLPNEHNVYIRPKTDPDGEMITTVHEMLHYIYDFNVDLRGDICADEEQAFAGADRVADFIGRKDLVRGDTWWLAYWHCQDEQGNRRIWETLE